MDKKFYKEYYKLERSHWWFTARLNILETLFVNRILKKRKNLDILNTGVATGATTTMLEQYGAVTSLEYDKDCCEFLDEVVGIKAINASLTELPFESNSFDVVSAFDVIEHIDDHVLAVQEIKRVLKPNGTIYLTVPAFNFLWSNHDVINHHYRRYTKKELITILEKEGFKIDYGSYFNFFLFLPILAVRMLFKIIPRKKNEGQTGSDGEILQSNGFVNKVLHWLFNKELIFLNRGIRLPFGVSVLVIGTKS